MNSKNIKGTITALVVAIVFFFGLLFVQKSILKPNGVVEVLIAVNDIGKGTVINENNIDSLFKVKTIDGELEVTGAIKDKQLLLDQIVNENLNKGEVISSNSFVSKDSNLKGINSVVETSFNVSDISQVVGGILRKGDIIDISVIDKNTGESETILKDVYIERTLSSDGAEIDRNSNVSALTINVLLSKADEEILNSNIEKGNLRISKKI